VITHIALFRWKPETTPEQIAAISAGLATLPGLIPSLKTYQFGTDIGASGPANMDYAVIATFETIEDFRAYLEHPEHDRVRAAIIRPWIAERSDVQLES